MRIRCTANPFFFIVSRSVAYRLSNICNWHIRIQHWKGNLMYYSLIPVPVYLILIFLYMVARNRFRRPLKFFFGPICYAGGQLLIALSCSYFLLH